jgi:uncharacterized membrane protein YdjX (TVP38/TMEM64 family)
VSGLPGLTAKWQRPALAVVIATVIILYFAGGEQYFSVHLFQDLFAQSPVWTAAIFFLIFFIGTTCSLPVAGAMSIASGVIFGHLTGFFLSLFAATLGGTLALYSVRVLFHDFVENRFSAQTEVVNKGIEKEGAFYLFGLRMIPVIPFWLLNLLVGLTAMRVPAFMLATLLGLIPVTIILTYAGSQLGSIETVSIAGIFTPEMILALGLMATFPFLARGIVGLTRRYAKNR